MNDANQEALRQCDSKDAEILAWAMGGWNVALADGPKNYAAASASSAAAAKAKALSDANAVSPGCRIVLCIGGLPQRVQKFE